MPCADASERVHIRRSAVELRGQNRPRARRDGRLDRGRIDQMVGAAFDRNRDGAGEMNGGGGGDHGMRAEDHFTAGLEAGRAQRDQQSVGGIGDADGVARAEEARQILLQTGDVALQNKRAAAADIAENRHQVVFLREKDLGIREEWDGGR